ncbi:copper resistance protein CopC [Alicyclobacillus vulcanalis]|uniref:Copper transport protein n=1 Tax=Alicyclobacillus vulcanalis TaxID=252246 RepID=A0A1N7JKK4_9BACL|nr:copper resistance protein CopC [Alicyclobacillus vulcanalis]SIS49847.1 copper transport protein [Alicyclobacillus vulcanalis]
MSWRLCLARLARWPVALMALVGTVFFHAPCVAAHAYVVHASPAPGQSLPSSPGHVQLVFDEPVQLMPGGLTVTNVDNQRVDLGDGHQNPARADELDVSVPKALPKGLYTVHWQVISADGHLVSGTLPFGVGIDLRSLELGTTEQGYQPGFWMLADRVLIYAGLALALGGFVGLLVARRALPIPQNRVGRRLALVGHALLVVGILFDLPLETAITWGLHGLAAYEPRYLARTLNFTRFGYLWVVELMLAAVIPAILAALSPAKSKARTLAAIAPLFAMPAALAMQGHAVAEPHPALPVLAVALHALAASVWVGGIAQMVALVVQADRIPSPTDAELRAAIRSFGWTAFTCVLALAATGVYSALLHVPTEYALFHTGYGKGLLAKAGLFLVMLGLAAMHALTPRPRRSTYRTWMGLELAASAVIFAITAAISNLPTAEIAPGPFDGVKRAGPYEVELSITPNRAGANGFVVHVRHQGEPDTAIQQVELILSQPNTSANASPVVLAPKAPGTYSARSLALSGGGAWDAEVQVLTSDFEVLTFDFPIHTGV